MYTERMSRRAAALAKKLTVSEYTFSAALPAPLTFAFVSDLHGCANEPVLAAIGRVGVDAVLVGGDFIHSTVEQASGLAFLAASAARWPTFCSLGNHEIPSDGAPFREMLAQTGARLLDNAAEAFRGVQIGGLTSGFAKADAQGNLTATPVPDCAFLERFAALPGFLLLLCHHPEYYERFIRPLPIPLTLSGHAHGGQWRPFGRALFAPGQGIFPRYTAGLYDGRLLVGRGLGNPQPIPRLWNPPELVIVRLQPC